MTQQDISFIDLMASSVHDMKNSLNVQVSALEKVAAKCRERGDASTFEDLGRVIYQASRMNSNLIQLLSLYKLGKSIYPIDMAEHCIAEVIEEALLQNKSIMEFKGIAISVNCAANCYWYFDRDLITGVLVNALNNAYQYTTDRITVAARIDDGFLELRVDDNGRGYPDNMLLQNGVSAHKGIDFLSGSTGLGFYFSSQVAAMHKNGPLQGSLTIENGGTYGGGCFVVRLP
jgi:two-component system sensor histidine kinase SenX3